MSLSWVDGRPVAQVDGRDRGLAYGDGLFETLKVSAGRVQRLDRHFARLAEGCLRLRLNLALEPLRGELEAAAAQLGSGTLKLIVTRGSAERGYGFAADAEARRVLLGGAAVEYPTQHAEEGIELFPCRLRLAEQPVLAGLKHLNRLEQVLARAEWSDSRFAEGLMCDLSGRLIEGVFSNLFLVIDGALLTPALGRCGVAGVMRAELIDLAMQHGVDVRVEDIPSTRLPQASEVFVCNSQFGIWPVAAYQALRWPVGPLTRKLQALLSGMPSGS